MPADRRVEWALGSHVAAAQVPLKYRFRPVCASQFRLSLLGCPQSTPSRLPLDCPYWAGPLSEAPASLEPARPSAQGQAGPRGGAGTSLGTLFSSTCSQFPRLVLARRLGTGK